MVCRQQNSWADSYYFISFLRFSSLLIPSCIEHKTNPWNHYIQLEKCVRSVIDYIHSCTARLAQSVERETLRKFVYGSNLKVVGSTPTVGLSFVLKPPFFFKKKDLKKRLEKKKKFK